MLEMKQHNTADDCWVVFHYQVYDSTNYANRHPNGPVDNTKPAGKDGTSAFENKHPIPYLVMVSGDVVGEFVQEAPAPHAPKPVQVPTNNPPMVADPIPPPMVADSVPAPAPQKNYPKMIEDARDGRQHG